MTFIWQKDLHEYYNLINSYTLASSSLCKTVFLPKRQKNMLLIKKMMKN